MKIETHKNTTCPACLKTFDIHPNRTRKIQDRRPVMWFADAMNQFEHFSEVTCPHCGENFKAKEAILFVIFKSPYTVLMLAVLLDLLLIALTLFVNRKFW